MIDASRNFVLPQFTQCSRKYKVTCSESVEVSMPFDDATTLYFGCVPTVQVSFVMQTSQFASFHIPLRYLFNSSSVKLKPEGTATGVEVGGDPSFVLLT